MAEADVHTMTGAYALDALDDVERRAFERHLDGCAACREEVVTLRETAARLAEGVAVAPPAALRDRVLGQVRTTPQLPPLPRAPAPGTAPEASPPGWAPSRRPADDGRGRADVRRPWMVAAAVAAVFALGGTGFGVAQWREARQAQQAALAAQDQARQVADVLGDPQARQVTGAVTGGGSVTLVVAGDRAVLSTAGLPGLPTGRTYQVWVVRPDGIRSAGLGPAAGGAAGSWLRPVGGLRTGDQVAVSVEPGGGSRQPTTTPIVAVTV